MHYKHNYAYFDVVSILTNEKEFDEEFQKIIFKLYESGSEEDLKLGSELILKEIQNYESADRLKKRFNQMAESGVKLMKYHINNISISKECEEEINMILLGSLKQNDADCLKRVFEGETAPIFDPVSWDFAHEYEYLIDCYSFQNETDPQGLCGNNLTICEQSFIEDGQADYLVEKAKFNICLGNGAGLFFTISGVGLSTGNPYIAVGGTIIGAAVGVSIAAHCLIIFKSALHNLCLAHQDCIVECCTTGEYPKCPNES